MQRKVQRSRCANLAVRRAWYGAPPVEPPYTGHRTASLPPVEHPPYRFDHPHCGVAARFMLVTDGCSVMGN